MRSMADFTESTPRFFKNNPSPLTFSVSFRLLTRLRPTSRARLPGVAVSEAWVVKIDLDHYNQTNNYCTYSGGWAQGSEHFKTGLDLRAANMVFMCCLLFSFLKIPIDLK